ncbi:MAG: cation-translocating P-type ATPase [Chitinophagaceae bacterium]|nr:cation-translocating P-type ATPase [Chitinophagaceae bacterium]
MTAEEVALAREQYGFNRLEYKKDNSFLEALKSLIKEPMILLLIAASSIYFITGETGDGIFLLSAIFLVAFISLYQDSRSRKALSSLKTLSQPHCKVIREGKITDIAGDEVVPGDYVIMEEGTSVVADGNIIQSNDFSVNESVLTGESLPVYKNSEGDDRSVLAGATVTSGQAVVLITYTGKGTQLGKIGKSLEDIAEEKTPLEVQISGFVRKMVLTGAVAFVIIWVINYYHSGNILDSLLKALTLAMSILPEEIPVAFTTFMAVGAWRLMKLGIIVKQMKTVETLGSATVICTDKTGTITENKMTLAKLYLFHSGRIVSAGEEPDDEIRTLVETAMWASEPAPFDPMEIALHDAYKKTTVTDKRSSFRMVHEYPLGGKPPMMTHIFENDRGQRIIAAKGAPEAMIPVSNLSAAETKSVQSALQELASNGYRVLGVGISQWQGDSYPVQQQDIVFNFQGLVAFYDPPKKNIKKVFEDFYAAGIGVKIVTGDNAATTSAIARQVGFAGADKSLTGDGLMTLTDSELEANVMNTNIFTRMFPDAKLRIINALKKQKQVVAMTGDGVNDGPALKAAHIGIAMGKKGTEVARQAASLVLMDDDLSKMVDAVTMGRKIYTNLKKAIQYIISIHIPIILTVALPLVLGWIYPNIFLPVHVIFLELIMGPTCSIIYENEPIEKNTMQEKPRPFTDTFFNWNELVTSIIQGLVITAGALFSYRYAVHTGMDENGVRTMVFTTLIFANIFLTLVNRSFYYSIFVTLAYKNNLVPLIIFVTLILLGLILYFPPASSFFGLQPPDARQLLICFLAGCVSVTWYEAVKLAKRRKNRNTGVVY